jgi:hypothetical protein
MGTRGGRATNRPCKRSVAPIFVRVWAGLPIKTP